MPMNEDLIMRAARDAKCLHARTIQGTFILRDGSTAHQFRDKGCEGKPWKHLECSVDAAVMAISYNLDLGKSALTTARDFIEYHPAVQGEWPLLVRLLNSAIAKLAIDEEK